MKVKLISVTKPVEELEGVDNALELIAYCARVSNPSNQNNSKTSKRLVEYLIDNNHWSPLEMVDATIEIVTTRDIARQILRHRSFKFQEWSQRYADVEGIGETFIYREARMQDPKNRQNSVECEDSNIAIEWYKKQQEVERVTREVYQWAISKGIAKEQARAVLPEGNTPSRLYMKGDIRSWIHYLQLRSSNGTQKEHIELALEIAKAISIVFPMTETLIKK